MSLLTLIQDSCDLIGITRPSTVIGSADLQVRQLFALAVEEAEELAGAHPWQAMTREHTFTTIASATQTGALPDDLDRLIPGSFYNRTTRRPVLGPVTPQRWQEIQANPQVNMVVLAYRQRDGAFLVTPTPPAGDTIAFEYVSTNWARSSDLATDKARWTADTDKTYLDESLIKLGLRWRWKKTKGLPYGEDMETYRQERDQARARDGGSGAIGFTGRGAFNFIANPNVPEGGFGQ